MATLALKMAVNRTGEESKNPPVISDFNVSVLEV
jgi:hypothetical protein